MMNFSLSTGNSVFPKTLTLTLALLFALVLDAAAQTVRGVVKDAAGTSLPGVTVLRNGDVKNGVITDLDGNYSIQANSADYLTFSYVGMKTQRVRVGNRRTINVTLADESSTLNDVVVVGYGTAKKSRSPEPSRRSRATSC
nr:carboxypeptidase-like regulatory domain-containing protein [Prevotella sp. oral taxon 820]